MGTRLQSIAMRASENASILVVDDRPENRFALEVVLESLNERIVLAESGEEALERVSQQDFAVILLDVNMPWLDGFETAELIRAQRKSDQIPIIFMTAYADDMHVARGYSLGAVDYILSPVAPEVLRSKVAFFVDLYRKNRQIRRQAALLGERAARQRLLADASLAIHSAPSLDRLLEVVTATAAELVNSRWAQSVSISDLRGQIDRRCSRVDGVTYAPRAILAPLNERESFVSLVLGRNEPVRQPDAIAERSSFADEAEPANADDATCTGRLAVPLHWANGSNMGLIQVAGASERGFTDGDEAVLLQLGNMASIAVENVLLAREREASQLKDEFLATLSHELRSPLSSILGWTHILAGQSSKNDPRLAEGLNGHRAKRAGAKSAHRRSSRPIANLTRRNAARTAGRRPRRRAASIPRCGATHGEEQGTSLSSSTLTQSAHRCWPTRIGCSRCSAIYCPTRSNSRRRAAM